MLLLKIANKSFSLHDVIIRNYVKHLFHNVKTLKFIKKEVFSFYAR